MPERLILRPKDATFLSSNFLVENFNYNSRITVYISRMIDIVIVAINIPQIVWFHDYLRGSSRRYVPPR